MLYCTSSNSSGMVWLGDGTSFGLCDTRSKLGLWPQVEHSVQLPPFVHSTYGKDRVISRLQAVAQLSGFNDFGGLLGIIPHALLVLHCCNSTQ